jgi:ribosomal protein L21
MFTVLLVATGGGASVAGAEVGAGASAGAKVMVGEESAGRARVLIIGDSVFDAFDHVESARELLDSQQKTIFAVQGCQKLVEPGCFAWVKLSALDQLKKNAGRFSDVVVIGTGYNDRIGTPFRQAVMAITQEAARQGVDVVWITYRQVRHVRGKATTMNKQLGKLDSRIENLHVADWNSFSEGKEKSGWFRGDRIHLVTPGAIGLAQLINQSVAEVMAKRELAEVGG